MPEKTSYQQLQPEERLAIASLRLQDVSIRAKGSPGVGLPELPEVSSDETALRLSTHLRVGGL
jgi:hypothetical protein